jgi:hypothetical protein
MAATIRPYSTAEAPRSLAAVITVRRLVSIADPFPGYSVRDCAPRELPVRGRMPATRYHLAETELLQSRAGGASWREMLSSRPCAYRHP